MRGAPQELVVAGVAAGTEAWAGNTVEREAPGEGRAGGETRAERKLGRGTTDMGLSGSPLGAAKKAAEARLELTLGRAGGRPAGGKTSGAGLRGEGTRSRL